MAQVRVGIVGCAMGLVGNHGVHAAVKIALSFASCNYLIVTGTIILELHSNVCDYLYKLHVKFLLFYCSS